LAEQDTSKIYTYDIDMDLTNRKLTIFQFFQGKIIRKAMVTKQQCKKLGFLLAPQMEEE